MTGTPNPESSHISIEQKLNYLQINAMQRDRERVMKMQLAHEYEAEIQRKEMLRRMEAQQRRKQKEAYAEGLKYMSNLQNLKTNQIYMMNRNNMQNQLQVAEKQRQQKLEQKKKQQQVFNQRYGKIPRSTSLGNIESSPKLAQFRQHYDKISTVQKQIQDNYIKKWSPLINRKQEQKDKLIFNGIVKNNQLLASKTKQKSQQQHRLQSDLKSTLISQILSREKQKQQQQSQAKAQNYTTSPYYRNIYHPICNPVDFKLNHDNKYVLKEIKEEQEYQERSTQSRSTGSNGLSGLARNGSYALLSK